MIDLYISQYGRRLYGLCLTLCKNAPDADDLYQETWLKAVKNIAQYDGARDFEPWLTRICVNAYRNTLRRASKSPVFIDAEALLAVPAPQKEDHSGLHEAIDRLPGKLRTAVILFYFRDMDLKTAALALGIPVGTVKSRLNKAKKLLKEAMSHEADIPF